GIDNSSVHAPSENTFGGIFIVSGMEAILLVEDKAELREMLLQALSRMGYQVSATANASAAASELRGRRFSAVLTDLKLPDGTGMDVLRAALDADTALPVFTWTGSSTFG